MLYVAQVVVGLQINTKQIDKMWTRTTYVYVKLVVHVLTTGLKEIHWML